VANRKEQIAEALAKRTARRKALAAQEGFVAKLDAVAATVVEALQAMADEGLDVPGVGELTPTRVKVDGKWITAGVPADNNYTEALRLIALRANGKDIVTGQ
jgi:hypothetical protein